MADSLTPSRIQVTEGGLCPGRALLIHLQFKEFSQNTLVTLSLPKFPGVPMSLNGCGVLFHFPGYFMDCDMLVSGAENLCKCSE